MAKHARASRGVNAGAIDSRTRRTVVAALRDLIVLTKADAASVWCRGEDGYFCALAGSGAAAEGIEKIRLPNAPPGFERKRPVLVPELTPDALRHLPLRARAHLRQTGVKAFASFPILIGGRSEAVLGVAFQQPHDFSRTEAGYTRLVARQIGAILEGALLLGESLSRERVLLAYADIAALVARSLELRNVLGSIAQNAQRIVDASDAFVFLAEPDGALVGAACSRRWERIFLGSRIEAGENAAAQWARRRRKTEIFGDAANDPRISRRLTQVYGTRAIMCAPLIARGREPLGVLAILETRGPRNYTRAQVASLETLANHAAAAIAHAATHAELRERERELRILSGRIADAHESERRRISRELHDVVGQGLAAASLELAAFERSSPTHGEALAPIWKILRETTTAARRLSAELHPAIVDDLGLIPALRFYATEVSRRSGLKITFDEPEMPPVSSDAAFIIYRAAQEGLTNVHRHAGAREVWIRLHRTERKIRFEIEDDGKGPPTGLRRVPGVGLIAIRERAASAGGRSWLEPTREGGSRLVVELPASRARVARASPRVRDAARARERR